MRVEQESSAAIAPLCRNLLPKGFKGKGEAIRWRNDLLVAVAQVHTAMTTVHRATRAVHSRFFYLERFRRNETGAVTLRWRETTGRYITWPGLEPTVRQLSPELRAWYAEAQLRAAWLNAHERALRYALGVAERLLCQWSLAERMNDRVTATGSPQSSASCARHRRREG